MPAKSSGNGAAVGIGIGVAVLLLVVVVAVVASSGGGSEASSTGGGESASPTSPSAEGPRDDARGQHKSGTAASGSSGQDSAHPAAADAPVIWFILVNNELVPFDLRDPEPGTRDALAAALTPYAKLGLKDEALREMADELKGPIIAYVEACIACEEAIQDHVRKHPEHRDLVPAVRASINSLGTRGGAMALQTVGLAKVESTFAAEARAADAKKIADNYGG